MYMFDMATQTAAGSYSLVAQRTLKPMFLFADEKMLPIAFRAEKRAGIPVKVE
jgi:hypothetical protein